MHATCLRYLLRCVRAGDAKAILILGDSLSAAYRIPTAQSWPALLQRRLSGRALPHLVVNVSRKGETPAGGLRRLPPLLEAYRPIVVVIELPLHVPAAYAHDFSVLFERTAREHETLFVPSLLVRVVDQAEYLLPDRLHPNAEAQTVLLETVRPALAAALGMARMDE